jgi:hypothetical protein
MTAKNGRKSMTTSLIGNTLTTLDDVKWSGRHGMSREIAFDFVIPQNAGPFQWPPRADGALPESGASSQAPSASV